MTWRPRLPMAVKPSSQPPAIATATPSASRAGRALWPPARGRRALLRVELLLRPRMGGAVYGEHEAAARHFTGNRRPVPPRGQGTIDRLVPVLGEHHPMPSVEVISELPGAGGRALVIRARHQVIDQIAAPPPITKVLVHETPPMPEKTVPREMASKASRGLTCRAQPPAAACTRTAAPRSCRLRFTATHRSRTVERLSKSCFQERQ
jgi:hypothetical protein